MTPKQISDYRFQSMEDNIKEIKDTIGGIFLKLDNYNERFISKEEHKELHNENKSRIARIEYGVIALLISLAAYLLTMAGSHIFK